jgi:Tfp pilus assembly protein PilF
LRELVAESPNSKFQARLAMSLVDQERFDDAEAVLAQAISDPEQAPVATLLMAQIRFGQGRYAEASELAEKVAQFGVRFPGMHAQLGRSISRRGGGLRPSGRSAGRWKWMPMTPRR